MNSIDSTIRELREEYKIMIEVFLPYEYEHEERIWKGKYSFDIYSLDNGSCIGSDDTEFASYDEAAKAGIDYVMNNLIKKED